MPPIDNPLVTDERDGQVINWNDVDHDGDMDAYVTNYTGDSEGGTGYPNGMYIRNGFIYTKVVDGRHVTDADVSLANTWGDADNDGDLDVFVANGRTSDATPGFNRLYVNDGNGGFTAVDAGITGVVSSSSGAAWADVDGDGDLDLYVTNVSRSTPTPGLLYRNDLASRLWRAAEPSWPPWSQRGEPHWQV